MYKLIIVLILTLAQQITFAINNSLDYIAQYKEIAISEMHRTGIPASIKMAQALLESGAGRSTLALEANNHFGIKCGLSWDGKTFYREDDDYHKGKLIESCFRHFDSVFDSYIAHSDFLTEQNRYTFLFSYDILDYKSWATGLRKAGYATDRSYAQKLIDIIEKYELHYLDTELEPILAYKNDDNPEREKRKNSRNTSKFEEDDDEIASTSTHENNGSRKSSSVRNNETQKALNEDILFHIVAQNQTLAEIASIYDIEENSIRLRNRLPKDSEPFPGEKIFLRKKISLLSRPKFTRNPDNAIASNDEEFIF